jgi:uncharacterized protein (TIGR03067 family)
MRRSLVAGLFLVGAAAAPLLGGSPDAKDLDRLQGRWSAKVGPRNDIKVEMTVEGQRAKVVITTPQGVTIRARGVVKIDDSCQPRALDWTGFKSSDGRSLPDVPAIYRIDDKGWTVCNGGFNGARPSTFQPGEGLLAGVVQFERADAQAARPSDSTARR